MPIYAPGKRDRHNRVARGGKRNVVASLSLTAMVDMFTVLVVFLLQNYNTTGEVIDISDDVILPKASAVKELRPAHVVVISKTNILLDKNIVASFAEVQAQEDWNIQPLATSLAERFKLAEEKRAAFPERVREAVDQTKAAQDQEPGADKALDDRRVTVQADKAIDFLTIKKVMFTLDQAGASEVNFAVMKEEKAGQVAE